MLIEQLQKIGLILIVYTEGMVEIQLPLLILNPLPKKINHSVQSSNSRMFNFRMQVSHTKSIKLSTIQKYHAIWYVQTLVECLPLFACTENRVSARSGPFSQAYHL